MRLNAIELALIAEHSLEMARANEAVADDPTKRLETRRRASEVAAAWRHRAEVLQTQALRQSAHPIVPGEAPVRALGRAYDRARAAAGDAPEANAPNRSRLGGYRPRSW